MFETEWSTYQANKKRLLATAEGHFVVIRGSRILGTYPNPAQAFDAGVKEFGADRFFLHRIGAVDPEVYSAPFIGMVSVPFDGLL